MPSLRQSIGGGIPILFLLYALQGIPFGLVTGSLPVLLSGGGGSSGASSNTDYDTNNIVGSAGGRNDGGAGTMNGDYRASSYISIASFPFGLKLLVAPIVDTLHLPKIGRRRSWIIPANICCSLLWLELMHSVDYLVHFASLTELPEAPLATLAPGEARGLGNTAAASPPRPSRAACLRGLTARLFLIVSVTAVGDVAVDGWALAVRHDLLPTASLAQTFGMTLGNFITNAGVLCGQTRACHEPVLRSSKPVGVSFFAGIAAALHILATAVVVLYTTEEQANTTTAGGGGGGGGGEIADDNVPFRVEHWMTPAAGTATGSVTADTTARRTRASTRRSTATTSKKREAANVYDDGDDGEVLERGGFAGDASADAANTPLDSDKAAHRKTPLPSPPPPPLLPLPPLAPSPRPEGEPAMRQVRRLTSQLLRMVRERRHCRTLLWLLLTSRVAFALTESGTLPSIEFVRAGGNLGRLALVITAQYPFQAILGWVVAQRLTPERRGGGVKKGRGGGVKKGGRAAGKKTPSSWWARFFVCPLRGHARAHGVEGGYRGRYDDDDEDEEEDQDEEDQDQDQDDHGDDKSGKGRSVTESAGGEHPLELWRKAHGVLLALAFATPVMTWAVAILLSPGTHGGGKSGAGSGGGLGSFRNAPALRSLPFSPAAAGGEAEEFLLPVEMEENRGQARAWLGTVLLGFVIAASNTVNKGFFVAQGAWFNQISDGAAGGTMITLLNSLSNCGRFFPRPLAFWLVGGQGTPTAADWTASFALGPFHTSLLLAVFGLVQLPFVDSWISELRQTTKGDWALAKPKVLTSDHY